MLLHVFFQIPLLCELGVAYRADKGLLSKVHACVVKKVPSFNELLGTAGVPAVDDPLASPWALAGDIADIIFIAFQNVEVVTCHIFIMTCFSTIPGSDIFVKDSFLNTSASFKNGSYLVPSTAGSNWGVRLGRQVRERIR